MGFPSRSSSAAARIALFSPGELRDRLREHGGVLGGDARDLPERQQTLRSTIEWSERLLDEDERSTFRLFSVFASARIEAVEAVAARLDGGAGADVLRDLVSLVDKSLVRSLDEDGHRRLAMLETIRDYAAERLDEKPEQRDEVRRAHAEHFADVAHERAGASHRSGADRGPRRAGGRPRQPARRVALLGGGRRPRATRRDARRALDAPRRPRLVPRGDRALERSALRALGSAGDGGAYRPGDHGAHEPRSRAHGDPRIHPGGRGHYADALVQLEETGEPSDAVPLLRSLAQPLPVPR